MFVVDKLINSGLVQQEIHLQEASALESSVNWMKGYDPDVTIFDIKYKAKQVDGYVVSDGPDIIQVFIRKHTVTL